MASNNDFLSQETSPEVASKQSISALIESVRNHPMIWDKADNDYKKAIKKSDLVNFMIQMVLQRPGNGIICAVNMESRKRSGPVEAARMTHQSNLTESQAKSPTALELHERLMREDNFYDFDDDMLDVEYPTTSVSRPTSPLVNTPKIKRRKQSEDSLDQAILGLVQRQQNETAEELFGRTVAQKLSRLEPKNRELAQMDIQKVLFNLEFMMTDDQ
ncbi:hypothetical protein DdX_03228 [Ditylenchus destructor]|uniref:MADF domain-containing protein n=1 Tax=Ditylenchus destructor TaxID=166010 RepID=A0AAD4NFH1_9BILA|nr:hypothetical protein DdX_03228 [Ditylenchus destructor]